MPLIRSDFFDKLAVLLRAAPATQTTIMQVAELIDASCPSFKKDAFLKITGYVSPKARVLKLGSKMKVVPLHRTPENADE